MKKLFALGLGALLLAACDPITGQMKVSKTFVANYKGFFGNVSQTQIKAGNYGASLDFESQTKAVLTLRSAQGEEQSMTLAIPEGAQVPRYSGPISLKGTQSGQPFDIKGEIDTDESDTGSTRTTESCSRTETRQICRRDHCETETITISGDREVEYHYHSTSTSMSLKLLNPSSKAVLATFSGTRYSSGKVYDYQGSCY